MEEKLAIYKHKNYYQLSLISNCLTDTTVATILKISVNEYRNILNKNGGEYFPEYNTTYFENEEDVKRAKDKIESILLMEKIIRW